MCGENVNGENPSTILFACATLVTQLNNFARLIYA